MKAKLTTKQIILAALAEGETTVPVLMDIMGAPYSRISTAADKLRAAGLVKSKAPPPGPREGAGRPPHILSLTAKGRKAAGR